MFNRCQLIGYVGADSILYKEATRVRLDFSLATKTFISHPSDGKKEILDWHYVLLYGPRAEEYAMRIKKGTRLFIEGSIRSETIKTEEGKVANKARIIASTLRILEDKNQDAQPTHSSIGQNSPNPSGFSPNSIELLRKTRAALSMDDDDIPF